MYSFLCIIEVDAINMEENKTYIKCPICATIQPSEVEFCVYCNTMFDKTNVVILQADEVKKEDMVL